jgi:hypothetical protein
VSLHLEADTGIDPMIVRWPEERGCANEALRLSIPPSAVLLVAIVGLAIVAPFWVLGTPKGADFEFHLPLWLDAADQWRQGIWMPRWAEKAEYSFGQPTFIFYPPLSWLLGAMLTQVLPVDAAAGGYVFLVTVLAGTCMFRLARQWVSQPQAAFAGVIYAASPYPLLLIYQHGSFAEVLAGALFPLLVLFALHVARGPWDIVPFAIVFAAIWLSNLPGALIATYSVGFVFLLQAGLRRSAAPLLYGGAGIGLGFALAGFYIVPAWYEQRWVQIGEVLAPGLEPETNFLFGWTYDPVAGWYPVVLSAIAASEILVALIAIALTFTRARMAVREVHWILAWLAIAATFLMFPMSGFAWQHLPNLRYVQFPTRWLTVLSTSLVLFLSVTVEARGRRAWVGAGAVLTMAAFGIGATATWHPRAATELQEASERDQGYFGRPEYMPTGSHYEELWQWVHTMPQAAAVNERGDPQSAEISGLHVELQKWTAEHKSLVTRARHPVTLGLRLLAYPAWRVELNGQAVQPYADASTGRMMVDIPPGRSELVVRLGRTPDRTFGACLSLVALMTLLWLATWRGRERSASV